MIKVKFNNTSTESFTKLKDGKVTVVSYNLLVSEDKLPEITGRVEHELDKNKRAEASFFITSIDFIGGTANVSTMNATNEHIKFLQNPSTKIFINSVTMNGKVTAITGFTAVGTY